MNAAVPAPDSAENLGARGMSLFAQKNYGEAVECFRASLRLDPANPHMWSNFSATLNELGRSEDSIGAAREAIRLKPDLLEAWNNLGAVLDRAGRPLEAIAAYEKAIALRPTSDLWSNLGNAYKAAGQAAQAIACYRQAVQMRPDNWRAWSNMLFVMNYSAELPLAEIAAAHRQFGQVIGQAERPVPAASRKRRLRLGFVSADFYHHPVGRLLLPVLEAARSQRFEWFAYLNNSVRDSLTERLCARLDGVRWITGASDEAFAAQVAADGIDILIDLSGHTAGNRLPAFARRLAPVQVGWLGYAFTTGVPAMDFILADAAVLPPEDETFYGEQVVRLPDFYLLAGEPDTTMAAAPPPMLRQGYPTFGSFNNPAKISPAVFALWGRLLRELPEARLLFKNKSFADANFCRHVTALMATQGIAANRLSFEGQSWGDAYFESFSRVDVALDPFPFPGLMTSLDTLWMGVPVVGLRERAGILGRHGARLLELIGHGDWVATDADAYLARARALVADVTALAEIRAGLRERLRRSPVMAADQFVAGFEAALLNMAASRGIVLAGEETESS